MEEPVRKQKWAEVSIRRDKKKKRFQLFHCLATPNEQQVSTSDLKSGQKLPKNITDAADALLSRCRQK